MNLGNQPVEILVEDVYLLVIPSPQTSANPEEDEARAQAAKAERLENAELLHMRSQTTDQSGERHFRFSIATFLSLLIKKKSQSNHKDLCSPSSPR